MIDPYLIWTSAYVTGMSHAYDRDHKRLANDAISFYEAMKLASNQAYGTEIEPIRNLKDARENESSMNQDGSA